MDPETAARVDRANRTFWREANAKAEESALIRRHDSPINLNGGYPSPDVPQIDPELATLSARIDDPDIVPTRCQIMTKARHPLDRVSA
jgi:hypothetical protein